MTIDPAAALRSLKRPDLTRVEIYGDESLKRGHYDILGGLWIRSVHASGFRQAISDARRERRCTGEVKWTKCSGSSPHLLYLDMVDLFAREIVARRIQYKCIVIDRRLVDNAGWNDGDAELGFFKGWWTLLLSRVKPGNVYHVRLDALNLQRTGRLLTLRDTLNAAARRDKGLDYHCCESVESRDSKKDDLIQMVDLVTGAVGFHYANGHASPSASAGKIELAERLCTRIGTRTLCFESKRTATGFNVWNGFRGTQKSGGHPDPYPRSGDPQAGYGVRRSAAPAEFALQYG